MKVLIIGGVAAGMSAAAKLKRLDPSVEVRVFENGPDVSYGACGLPYFISGLNPNPNLMRVRSVAQFKTAGIDVSMGTTVTRVEPADKTVFARHAATGREISDTYDKLIVGTGASPIVPSLPGGKLPGIFTLKTIPDAEAIHQALTRDDVKNVVIIGAGAVGMELVESCVTMGKKAVRVIEMKDQVLPPMDADIAVYAQHEAQAHGVVFNIGQAVSAFTGKGQVREVVTNQGVYPADLVVLCIGVTPNTGFLKDTGLEMLANGAIVTDRKMQTNLPDIYAAGDCATVWHKLLDKPVYLPLGTNANKQGRALAETLMGIGQGFSGTLGTAVLRVLDVEMGRTGLNETEARQNNLPYNVSMVQVMSHPPYFPGATPLHIKLLYHPQSKVIMGAQLVGRQGAVNRVATMAVIIDQKMTTRQMNELDLPYAPPFTQVWDPLHVASGAAQ